MSSAATDDIPGLGRLVQLVLRADGLTTTSLTVLTGDPISVQVLHHAVHGDAVDAAPTPLSLGYASSGASASDRFTGDAYASLALPTSTTGGGSRVLVRKVLLRGPDTCWGASSVIAALDRVPAQVAESLATTDLPIGQTLHRAGVITTRRLRKWGLSPAGEWSGRLAEVTSAAQRVPTRSYVMHTADTGEPLAHFVEWFSPAVFTAGEHPPTP